ncbi:MAG: hydrolase [Clostridiales bacterium]|nr:hydrolase [Clostridiales bacterium]
MSEQKRVAIPLSDAEKKNPISKYYSTELAPLNQDLMKCILAGPMDPKNAIYPEDVKELLKPGYVEGETGYCVMDNGAGYVAVNNKFPGVTLEMMKWWFAWHPLESLRYKIWDPYCHPYAAIADVDRAKIKDPNVALEDKISDVVHFVVEDVGAGMQDVVIHFLTPEEIGFTKEELAEAKAYAIGGYALVENREGEKGKSPVIMLHYYRETPDGIESRTRFWMGYRIVKGQPMCILPPGMKIPADFALGLALHNVEEYSNLASLLPKLYAEYGDQPF